MSTTSTVEDRFEDDSETDQALQRLLRAQPGLTMPEPARARVLESLADEAPATDR